MCLAHFKTGNSLLHRHVKETEQNTFASEHFTLLSKSFFISIALFVQLFKYFVQKEILHNC